MRTTFSTARNGTIAYRTPLTDSSSELVVMDRSSRELRAIGAPASIWHIALSHDEKRLALEMSDPKTMTTDLWMRYVDSGVTTRLTFSPKYEWQPLGRRMIDTSTLLQIKPTARISTPARRAAGSRRWSITGRWRRIRSTSRPTVAN